MKELVRLVEGDASAAQRTLLEAGQAHRPPNDQARARTLAALTAVAGGVAVGSTAVGVTAGKSLGAGAGLVRAISPAILKWCAVAAVGVSASAVLVVRHEAAMKSTSALSTPVTRPKAEGGRGTGSTSNGERVAPPSATTDTHDRAPSEAPAPAVSPMGVAGPGDQGRANGVSGALPGLAPRPAVASTPVVARVGLPSAPPDSTPASSVASSVVADEAHDAPSTRPGDTLPSSVPADLSTGAPTSASRPEAASLALEVRMLDEVRAHLSSHDAGKAQVALDRYTAAFPGGVFLPEASVLRIEALLLAGDHASATRLADKLQRTDPNGPYAQRVRKLIQGSLRASPLPATK